MYTIEHDYHAYHHSGNRPYSACELFVLHDMESKNYLSAAEITGHWFEERASGGSTTFGVDNNSIQQYLPRVVIPWGAPGANENGIHIEQMGVASWTTNQWKEKGIGTLDRTAWLLAHEHLFFKHNGVTIPLVHLSDEELKAHRHGIVTHRQLTRVLHTAGGHTDPGTGYPLAWVIERAQYYKRKMVD